MKFEHIVLKTNADFMSQDASNWCKRHLGETGWVTATTQDWNVIIIINDIELLNNNKVIMAMLNDYFVVVDS